MPYELTASAQEDLEAIANGNGFGRRFSTRFPQILVSRCEHHYIFYVHPHGKPARIIAVLHENMDLVNRLKDRLG